VRVCTALLFTPAPCQCTCTMGTSFQQADSTAINRNLPFQCIAHQLCRCRVWTREKHSHSDWCALVSTAGRRKLANPRTEPLGLKLISTEEMRVSDGSIPCTTCFVAHSVKRKNAAASAPRTDSRPRDRSHKTPRAFSQTRSLAPGRASGPASQH
jgi:hypothetical protein